MLIVPGNTALTRILEEASSFAAVRVRPTTACLDIIYGDIPGAPIKPAREDVFRIAPDFCFFITGMTFCKPRNTPRTLTLYTRSSASTLSSSMEPVGPSIPALLAK
ncbi:hypothetical protein D3C73_1279040 [compost metagenome]